MSRVALAFAITATVALAIFGAYTALCLVWP